MTLLANTLQRVSMFNAAQKGFVPYSSLGEHIIKANEINSYASRHNMEMFQTAIDITNAFGTVPHKLIFDSLRAKGLNNDIIELLEDLYNNAQTSVFTPKDHSQPIQINRGVLQGCPLSPVLFNCCIDPLLWAIKRRHSADGFVFEHEHKTFSVTAQAYADDILIISPSQKGMQSILDTINEFQALATIKVAPSKCLTLARIPNAIQPFHIGPDEIPMISANDKMIYLGAPVSTSKVAKIQASKPLIEQVKNEAMLTFSSTLTLNQKIDALRTFILPKLEFSLTNGMFAINDLKKLDEYIRGKIDENSMSSNLPKEFFYVSTSHGGLGLQKLETLQPQLQLTKYLQARYESDETTMALTAFMREDEIQIRGIEMPDSTQPIKATFIDNKIQQTKTDKTTSSLFIRAVRACHKLGVEVKITRGGIAVRGLGEHATNWHPARNTRVVRRLVSEVLRERCFFELQADKKHGRAFVSTNVYESHTLTSKPYNINNNLFITAIAMRTDTAPTPDNVKFHHGNSNGLCKFCQRHPGDQFHELNGCESARHIQKWRHDIIVDNLLQIIKVKFPNTRTTCSCQVSFEDILPEDVQLEGHVREERPDIVVYDHQNEHIIMFEVMSPYDKIVENYTLKKTKYENLRTAVEAKTKYRCSLIAIIVSALGIIPSQTKKDLLEVFDTDTVKLFFERSSIDALAASACILFGKPPAYYGLHCNKPMPQPQIETQHTEENQVQQAQQNKHRAENNTHQVSTQISDLNSVRSTQNNGIQGSQADGSTPDIYDSETDFLI